MGILLWCVATILGLLCLLAVLVILGFPVRVAPSVIEKAVAVKLPLRRPLKPAGELEVTSVHLDSSGKGDRLGVQVDVTVGGLPALASVGGQVHVLAQILWKDPEGELFIRDSRFEQLSVQGLPDLLLAPIREAATLAVREILEERPVWRLEPKTRALAAVRALLRDVWIRNGSLEVSVGGSVESLSRLAGALTGHLTAR